MRLLLGFVLCALLTAPAWSNPLQNGRFGSALQFDGADDYVWFAANASGLAQGTVELWMSDSTPPRSYQVWGGGIGLPGTRGDWVTIGRHVSSTGFSCGVYSGIWRWADTGEDAPAGWTHVAMTWGPDGIRTYLNGALEGTYTFNDPLPSYPTELLGASSWGVSYVGLVDDLRVWNVQRTESEIRSTMAAPLGPEIYQSPTSGLVAYYPLDSLEDLGVGADGHDDVRDLSPNANHGDSEGGVLLTSGAVQLEATSWSRVKSLY